MKITNGHKILLLTFIILAGNILIGYSYYQFSQKLSDSKALVQHTQEVLHVTDNISSQSKDIQLAERGFIITNDQEFLTPLYDNENSIFDSISNLKELTKDNAAQQEQIDSLDFYTHKRLEFFRGVIQIRNSQGLEAAIAEVSTKQGKVYSEKIDRIIDNIKNLETSLLNQRQQSNEISSVRFNNLLSGILVFMAALTIFLLVIARYSLTQSEQREKRAAELVIANKELLFQRGEKEKRASELIIANKELIFQGEEKEKRAAELMVANRELEQFAYIASHDLQEPLRTISNYMQVFEEDYLEDLDENARKYIRSVNNATKRMSVLVRALLDFSRLGRDKKLVFVDCKELIDNVIADLQSIINESKTTISVGKMPSLNVYETEIRQLFQNLITNAIKFQKKDSCPEIEIRCEKEKEKWQFSVKDNGIGIEPEYFQTVFDIFQRLHHASEFQGYGIGLANGKKIVALHGGEIWIESTLGKGSTFNFTISIL